MTCTVERCSVSWAEVVHGDSLDTKMCLGRLDGRTTEMLHASEAPTHTALPLRLFDWAESLEGGLPDASFNKRQASEGAGVSCSFAESVLIAESVIKRNKLKAESVIIIIK